MRARQMVLMNILIIVVVAALAVFGSWYFYNRSHYIHANDASVNVPTYDIVATAAGKLTTWSGANGSHVTSGGAVGVETLPTGQTVDLTAPVNGQVLRTDVVQSQVVAAGTLLAVVANLNQEYIAVNVKETEIRNVQVGQAVDIYLDAYPGTTFSGTVTQIGHQSAAQTSPFPSTASSGNFSKEVQRIPVRISIDDKQGKDILPGMNAEVRIHRNNP